MPLRKKDEDVRAYCCASSVVILTEKAESRNLHKYKERGDLDSNSNKREDYLLMTLQEDNPKIIVLERVEEIALKLLGKVLKTNLQLLLLLILRIFDEEEGIDYDEVFAHVARIEAIRLFLAFASFMGFIVYQMDVKSAFLYGTIDEEVYVSQPPGFVDPDHPKKFIRWYVAEILKKFDLVNVKTAITPMETKVALTKDEEAVDVDVHLYRSMIVIMVGLTLTGNPQQGGLSFLGQDFSWAIKKQDHSGLVLTMIADSSCCKLLWTSIVGSNQLLDYGFNFMNTKIHIDNESTICIVKNPVYHSKTKHIEIRHHFIRELMMEEASLVCRDSDFHEVSRPQRGTKTLLPTMLLVATTNSSAGQEHPDVAQSQPSSSTIPRISSTKLTMGSAIVKLVKKVKKLEGILKRRNVVLSDSEEEEPEAQRRKSQDDPLVSLVTRAGVNTVKELILAVLRPDEKEKRLGIIEEVLRDHGTKFSGRKKKNKKKKAASLAEAIRLDTLEKEEEAKQEWKLSQWKNLSFERSKEEFDKMVKLVEFLFATELVLQKDSLKRFTRKGLHSDKTDEDESEASKDADPILGSKGLTSPEQMATGKGISNPFMAVMVCQKPYGIQLHTLFHVLRVEMFLVILGGLCHLSGGQWDELLQRVKITFKEEDKRIAEDQVAKDRYWKIPICYDDDDDEESSIPLKDIIISGLPPCVAITPVLLTEEPVNSLIMEDEHLDTIPATMCDVPFCDNSTPLEVLKDHYEIFINSNDDDSSSNYNSLYGEDIDYVDASSLDSVLVSLEVVEIVIPEVEGIDIDILLTIKDDNLREKILNVNLLIAKIEALKDNPTPSSDFVTKSSSTSLNFFLEETNTFDNSLPESETSFFNLEEISSGSPTSYSDLSLPDYEAFFCDSEPDSGNFTMDVMEDIFDNPTREPRVHVPNVLPTRPTLHLDLDFTLSSDSLGSDLISPKEFSISFMRDPLSLVFNTLLPFSSENEDKVLNPGILASNEETSPHLLSHRGFNPSKIISDFSESPMMISGGGIPILDVSLLHFYPS
ncbi:ribonuclease H-like domain-containing protein [Tanacetum coccineum]